MKKPHIRKLTRMGGGRSLGLVLPADLVRELNWRERQKVIVKKVGKRIVVEDWPVRQTQGKKK